MNLYLLYLSARICGAEVKQLQSPMFCATEAEREVIFFHDSIFQRFININCSSISAHYVWNMMRYLTQRRTRISEVRFRQHKQNDKKVIWQNYSGFYCTFKDNSR